MFARTSMRHFSATALALALSAAGTTAVAQVTSNNLPTSVQPGNVENQLPHAPAFNGNTVEMPAQPEIKAPTDSEKVRFKLVSLTVEGSTVYTPEQLAVAYKGMIGREVSLADMYAVANKLTVKYRTDGYILSRVVVPAQDVTSGKVKLIAVEGFINKVSFNYEKNAERSSASRMEQAVADAITASKPLRAKDLERSLLLLNDTPGLSVRAVVKPSTVENAADVQIILSYKPIDGYVQFDNRGTRYIGPMQGVVGVHLNDIAHDGGTLGLRTALSSDANELRFGEVGYTHALTTNGLSANVLGSDTFTRPGFNLTPFDVEGKAQHVEAGLSYPLIRGRSQNLAISGKFTSDSVSTDTLGSNLFDDQVRALRLGLDWQKADIYNGFNAASAQLSQGMSILGASESGAPNLSRAAAKPDFTKIAATLSREQYLNNSNWSFAGSVGGQYADKPLYASEEFGLGGATFLSAFDPNEVAGEDGIAARIEPRYTETTDNRFLNSVQYYAFYDSGMVTNRDALAGSNKRSYLSSAGIGARLFAKYGFSGSLEAAKPMVGTVATQGDDDPRVFFRLTKNF